MDIDALTLVYFSPTRTTRRIVEGVAAGLAGPEVQTIDLTPADAARTTFPVNPRGLTIIGGPVYAGRIPADMRARLGNLEGCGGPAVVIVTYGNRAYEDALLELRDIAMKAGFHPIAAGAFIGEHSYSQEATPIALGRPDRTDLEQAEAFGRIVRDKLRRISPLDAQHPIQVPGNFPYKELSLASGIAPTTDKSKCDRCETCISICPVGAISAEDPCQVDAGSCIRCCACVKSCPAGAKVMDHERINQFREYLTLNHTVPKKPEIFL